MAVRSHTPQGKFLKKNKHKNKCYLTLRQIGEFGYIVRKNLFLFDSVTLTYNSFWYK